MHFQTSRRIYAHIDWNSFYASCEVLRDPSLKGKCVCVWDQIVIAASYEAKKYGIGVGTPIWECQKILGKNLVQKIPDHTFYKQVSDRIMGYLSKKLGHIEVFSIDELFAEVTGMAKDYAAFAEEIKMDIYRDIGMSVSVGISNTRIRAKMFGDLYKPFGSFVAFDTTEIEEVYQKLGLREIPYIGRGSADRLGYSIRTVYDFYAMDPWEVSRLLGKNGVTLWLELRWADIWTSHDTSRKRKSIISSRSFNRMMTTKQEVLWNHILGNFEHAYETMLSEKQWAKVIGIMLRTKEFRYTSSNLDMGEVNIDRTFMVASLKKLLAEIYTPGTTYRTTGVKFHELSPFTPRQLSIFDTVEVTHVKNEKLSDALSKIKNRFGDGIVSQWLIAPKKTKKDIWVLFEVG
jgi:nucleotidyltransferase/DNA polymerase involved in DNA repair